ncbi:hypothetical protein HDV04_002906 [Boothiomyces sp. JEL0838]|nr:hypothetical protein HDV04_002906 [Boothiomyces sp. JEL0838]
MLRILKTRPALFTRSISSTSDFVKIVEVGPRDGLQNEPTPLTTNLKLELISKLVSSGLQVVEAAAFVSPKWVPQMADASEVYKNLPKTSNVAFPVLCPNVKGLEAAMKVGVKEIAVFGAASESFSKKNINCTIQESIQRFGEVIKVAKANNIKVRGYVSTVVGCPYEGYIEPQKVARVAKALYDMGCYEISLGDTIGVGTPDKFEKMIDHVAEQVPINALAVHCHDTYGQAIGNIIVSLRKGIRVIDSSVAGLGGCPYAAGASGNVATEDVIYLLNGLGMQTGVDLETIVKTGTWISRELGRQNMSKAGVAISAKLKL